LELSENNICEWREPEKLIITSTYLLYDVDEPPPTKEVRDVTDYCSSRRKQLIIGSDTNAHHII
jgi:hypothetical protein